MTGSTVTGSVVGEGGGASSGATGLTDATSVAITGGTISGVTLTATSVSGGTVTAASLINCAITSCSASGGLYVNPTQDSPNLKSYSTTTPTAPASGATLFARNRAGVVKPAFINANDPWADIQTALYRRNFSFVASNGTSGVSTFGPLVANISSAGATAATFATTNLLTSVNRTNYNTTGSAGTTGLWFDLPGGGGPWRGNAAGLGGFFVSIRFGIETHQAAQRLFVGLNTHGASMANADPSTITNIIGVGMDSGDTNLSFMSTNNSGTLTKTTLGANFPGLTDGAMYELRLYAKPNDTVVYWSVERLDSAQFTEGSESTNLFPNTSQAGVYLEINNGSTAAIAKLALINIYLETPY